MIFALFAAFLLFRIPNFTLINHGWSDINLYKMLADRIMAGQTPYVDFPLEYPPLALIFFAVPGMVASVIGNFDIPYRLLMMLFDIGCLLLVGAIARQLSLEQDKKGRGMNAKRFGMPCFYAQIIYLALTAVSFQVLYDRFDIAVAFLVLLAIYFALAKNWLWAYIVIVLGAFTKLFPAILLPIMVIYQIRRNKVSSVIRDFGIAVIAGLCLLIVSIALFGDWWGYMLEYHGRRGIQIESLYASIAMLTDFAGIKAVVEHEYGAYQITNAFSGPMTKASMVLMGCSILVVYIFSARKTRLIGNDNRRFVLASLLALISFALFNKVLSPQFFLWLFPLVSVLAVVSARKFLVIATWGVIAILTTAIFPYSYRSLLSLDSAVALLIARNALFAIAAVAGFMMLARDAKTVPPTS
jgi:hypothetical protein